MIFALIFVYGLAAFFAAAWLSMWRRNIAIELWLGLERERVTRLVEMLMARSAPAEYAAYMDPTPPEDPDLYRFSDDGLIATPWSEE